MKSIVIPLAVFGFVVMAAETASAASPAYCALYAREYANQMVEVGAPAGVTVNAQDQAYYRCLNQDEDPVLPTASAYFGTDIDNLAGDEATASADAAKVVTDPAPTKKPVPIKVASSSSRSRGGSGLDAWTPEWRAWCEDHFPKSFNPDTGMVKPYKTNKWRFCD
jgi:hypothetical protein